MIFSKSDRLYLLSQERVGKALGKLAIPSILGMLVVALYNLIDAAFIGYLNDTRSQAALSVIFPLTSFFMAIGQMIGISGGAYLSFCLGENNFKRAEDILTNALWCTLGFSMVLAPLILIFFEPILFFLGATESTLQPSLQYGRPLIFMCFLTVFTMTANNFIRAEGNTFVSMAGIALGAIANCILDPLFMFCDFPLFHYLGWHRSISGAAWATVIAQLLSALFLLNYMIGKRALVRARWRKWHWNLTMFKEVAGVAVATFSRQALIAFSMVCFNLIAKHCSSHPDVMLASIGVVLRVTSLPFLMMIGYIHAFLPFVAYCDGAGLRERLKRAVSVSQIGCFAASFVICVLIFIFSEQIAGFFLRDSSADGVFCVKLTTIFLRLFVVPMPFLSSYLLFSALFQALRKTVPVFLLATARNGIFFLPVLFILPFLFSWLGISCWGIDSMDLGIIFSQPLADVLSIVLGYAVVHQAGILR